MEKRVVFRSAWLPWVLMAPQLAVIGVFFFWPAAQALLQSLQQPDAFGTSVEWVGLENFRNLWNDATYLASFKTTAMFSVLVAVAGHRACRCCWRCSPTASSRAHWLYKTLLIWPYAVAPAVAGVLWLFMFAPSVGIVSYALRRHGLRLEPPAQRHPRHDADRDGGRLEADFLQLPVLPGRPADHPEVADRGRGHRRRRPWRRFWTIVFPLLSPTTFFLLVINIVYAFFDTFAIIDAATQGGPGKDTAILVYKVYYDGFKAMDLGGSAAQSVVLMVIVIALTVVQFRFVEKKVNY